MDNGSSTASESEASPNISSFPRKRKAATKTWYRCFCCGTTSWKNPERRFFGFPKDPVRSKQWAAACNKDLLSKSADELYRKGKVCSIHFTESDFRTTKFHYLHSCAVRKKLGQTDDESQKTMDVVHTETSLTQTVKTDETQELPYVNEDQEKEAIKTPDTHCKVYTPKSLKIKRLTSQVSYLKKKYCHGKNSVRIVDILKIIQPVVHILILLMWAKLKITRPVSFEL